MTPKLKILIFGLPELWSFCLKNQGKVRTLETASQRVSSDLKLTALRKYSKKKLQVKDTLWIFTIGTPGERATLMLSN